MNTTCTIQPVSYKSKLERDYADVLAIQKMVNEIVYWQYEAISLRLASGAFYKPDFLVLQNDGQIRFDETKGFWREAARVRIKVAAREYPFFRFQAVTREKKQWQYERINP